jgi:hypothetical protein
LAQDSKRRIATENDDYCGAICEFLCVFQECRESHACRTLHHPSFVVAKQSITRSSF